MIYITSDFHLFHENIMNYCNRYTPDRTCIQEYQNDLIYYLSNLLKEDDTLIYLGDLACSSEKSLDGCKGLLALLKCEKHFIRGNHDKWLSNEDILSLGFKSVRDYLRLNEILLCHYSLSSPYGMFGRPKMHEYIWDKFYENPEIQKIYHGHNHNTPLVNTEIDGSRRIRKFGDCVVEYVNCCIDKNPNKFNVIQFTEFDENSLKEILNSSANDIKGFK